jgi:hypothetical protein
MRKILIILFFNLSFCQFILGQIDTVKNKRHFSYGFEIGYSASRWFDGDNNGNQSISDITNRMFLYSNHGIVLGGVFDYKPAKPFFYLETGILLQQKIDIIYVVLPINIKIYLFQRHKTNLFLKFGINNDVGIIASTDKFGSTKDGKVSRYDFGINYGLGLRLNLKNNRKGELWIRTSSGFGVTQENEPFASGAPDYVLVGIKTLELGINYQIFKK